MELFSQLNMTVALHKATQTELIIESVSWTKGEQYYKCLVPQKDEKGRWHLCNATYSDSELDLFKRTKNGLTIIIEEI